MKFYVGRVRALQSPLSFADCVRVGRPKSVTAPALVRAAWRPSFGVGTIRLSQVWAAIGIVLPVVVISATPLFAIDLTYHLRAGDIMFDTHAVLRTDVFSSAAYGSPWLNQQWLAQIVLATAFRLGGWFGLVALRHFSWGSRSRSCSSPVVPRGRRPNARHGSRWRAASCFRRR